MKNNDDILEKQQIIALKADDIKAFDILFAEYSKRLYHFAYGYLKSKEEAEEVVQEVFLRIWRNRKSLKPELSFKAYIFKIAYHYILELFKESSERNLHLHEIAEASFSHDQKIDEKLDYSFLLSKVQDLIDTLPKRQKEILIKRKIEGIPVKEIAAQIGITPKTVENHLTQALKNIKISLEKEDLSGLLFFILFVNI